MNLGQKLLRRILPHHEEDRRQLRQCVAIANAHAEDLTRTILCSDGRSPLEQLEAEEKAKQHRQA